jgi:hypothetical protein
MHPVSIPRPETPNMSDAPLATAAVPPPSSVIPAPTQKYPNVILIYLRRLTTTVADVFIPEPVRQGWVFLFYIICNKIATYPATHRYGSILLILLAALAEYEQPGFIPPPRHIFNALISFTCVSAVIVAALAVLDLFETNEWPWEQEGWVWPWQVWLWNNTIYEFSTSTSTCADESSFYISSCAAENRTNGNDYATMTPPSQATFKQPFIIPPTPQLPGGLRPASLPSPTPEQVHKSGIIGESPMPDKFRHFPSYGSARKGEKLGVVAE